MTNTDETRVALLLSIPREHYSADFMRVEAHAVSILPTSEIRNFSAQGYDAHPLGALVVRAQADVRAEDPKWYGWSVEYRDLYSVDLRHAEIMVKQLRKINRTLEKMQADFGYPETFAAYLARIGKVIGASSYGWKTSGEHSMYADNIYRWTDANGAASWLSFELDKRTQNASA